MGHDVPLSLFWCMGGVAGNCRSTIAFLGNSASGDTDNSVVVAKVKVRYNIGRNHYISLVGIMRNRLISLIYLKVMIFGAGCRVFLR